MMIRGTRAKIANPPHVDKDHSACRYEVTLVLVVLDHGMRDTHGRGVLPPEALLDDCLDVWQVVSVRVVRKAMGANNRV